LKTRPGDRTRRSGPSPGGMGWKGCHPVGPCTELAMASLWSPRVQVRPSRVLHGSEPWALSERWCGPHGRPRAGPSPNWNPRGAGAATGAPALPLTEQLAVEPILAASEPPSRAFFGWGEAVRFFFSREAPGRRKCVFHQNSTPVSAISTRYRVGLGGVAFVPPGAICALLSGAGAM
jgi:hypothetical protein